MRFLIALVFFTACGDSTSPSTDAGPDFDVRVDSNADTEPCGECDAVSFAVEVDGVSLTDGAVVEWEWGFQGGTMMRPTIVFESGVTAGETVELEIRHDPDPDAPELFGEGEDFRGPYTYFYEVLRQDGRMVVGPIDDQLGWDELDGMRLVHTVRVNAPRGTATRNSAIEMATSGPSPCDVFEVEGRECSYYVIPGSVSVSIGDPDPVYASCADAAGVMLAFTPDDMESAVACADTTGWELLLADRFMTSDSRNPPASCLDEVGLTEGATLRATLQHIRRGTCTPSMLRLVDDVSACDEMCL